HALDHRWAEEGELARLREARADGQGPGVEVGFDLVTAVVRPVVVAGGVAVVTVVAARRGDQREGKEQRENAPQPARGAHGWSLSVHQWEFTKRERGERRPEV